MKFYKENEFKETQIGRIPKDWKVVKLEDSEVSYLIKSGSTPSRNRVDYWNGTIPFVTIGDMTKTIKYLYDTESKITEFALKNSNTFLVAKDSILLSMYGTIGKIVINKIATAISQNIAGIIPNRENVYVEFLHYALMHFSFQFKSAKIITLKHLDIQMVKNTKIPLPPLNEQRAIAEILSTVDEAIQKIDEMIAKTERLKKGLMQELLTKGIGHKEFKDTEIGRIPKDWEVVKIGDIAQTSSGGTPNRAKKEYYNGNIPWVKSSELKDNIIYDTEEKITEEGLQNSSAKIFPKGTLLVAMYGATVGKTGILGIDAATNQAICAILPNKTFDPNFLKNYIIFRRDRLISISSGGAQPNISQEIIRAFKIPLPPLQEQQRIAEILFTIDKKLEIERDEKAKLERIKQGLMNLLLTGKIRIKVS